MPVEDMIEYFVLFVSGASGVVPLTLVSPVSCFWSFCGNRSITFAAYSANLPSVSAASASVIPSEMVMNSPASTSGQIDIRFELSSIDFSSAWSRASRGLSLR